MDGEPPESATLTMQKLYLAAKQSGNAKKIKALKLLYEQAAGDAAGEQHQRDCELASDTLSEEAP